MGIVSRKKFSQEAVPKCKVIIKLISIKHNTVVLQEGYTGADGLFNATFTIPELNDEAFTLVMEGSHPTLGNSDIKYVVKKRVKQ